MIEKTEENLAAAGIDGAPDKLLADAGYCSEDNLVAAEDLNPDVLVATGRQRRGEKFKRHHAARSEERHETREDGPSAPDAKGPCPTTRGERRSSSRSSGR